MNARRIVLTSTLAVPVLLLALASCNDGNQNPAAPNTPGIGTPSTPSTGARITDVHRIRLRQPSVADLAEAVKADLATEAVTTTALFPRAKHDPSIPAMRIQCLDGAEFGFPPGTSDPFRPLRDHGCELNTLGGGAAIALPFQNLTRGRKVANTTRLEFYYAGGPQNGGAPRFSLFTDFCKYDDLVPTHSNVKPCGDGGTTDGEWDETLFIDVNGCNDGDVYVGAVLLKSSPNSQTDATCNIYETYGPNGLANDGDEHVHPNWADYVAAHPNDRFALGYLGDRFDNFIIADVPVHYLVYRIRMTATGG